MDDFFLHLFHIKTVIIWTAIYSIMHLSQHMFDRVTFSISIPVYVDD